MLRRVGLLRLSKFQQKAIDTFDLCSLSRTFTFFIYRIDSSNMGAVFSKAINRVAGNDSYFNTSDLAYKT